MRSVALEALLKGLVDYAGLFPPAALPMRAAMEQYALYRESSDRWMLGRFVLPATRLAEFEHGAVGLLGAGEPWSLSVIAGPADLESIAAFNAKYAGQAVVDTIEAKAASPADVEALAVYGGRYDVYVEIPLTGDSTSLLGAIKSQRLRAKLRTGGVTAEAFPTTVQLAHALAECVRQGVAFKVTAGLHHPLRGDYRLTYDDGSPSGAMFGFLNVFLASFFLRQGMPVDDVVALLDERNAASLEIGADGMSWRGHALDVSQIRMFREQTARSFGSCSFTEPVADLTSLGFL